MKFITWALLIICFAAVLAAIIGLLVSVWKLLMLIGLAAPLMILLGTILIVGAVVALLAVWAVSSLTIH